MNTCFVDNKSIELTDMFNFVSAFEAKTGFGLSDIYQWLNPDIAEPEEGKKGYKWEEANTDYQLFQFYRRCGGKRISLEVADAFFSACENFKIYAGERAKDIQVDIRAPFFAKSPDRILVKGFKRFVEKEKMRTGVSHEVIGKLLPEEITANYKISTYIDALKERHNYTPTISIDLAKAIQDIYSKIPGRDQMVDVQEGLEVPVFGTKYRFSVSSKTAVDQLKDACKLAKSKGIYKSTAEFTRQASELLQADVHRLFDKTREAAPRLRVAICLALLEGREIPQEVLDVHRALFEPWMGTTGQYKNAPIVAPANI